VSAGRWAAQEMPALTSASDAERRVVEAIQGGLPLVPRPYAVIAERIGMSEGEVLAHIQRLHEAGTIKRLGVVVRHHELGYRANAMVVWDVPDHRVRELGQRMSRLDFVTLCYQRPRRRPHWPYNLFCMIHGQDREAVLQKVRQLTEECALQAVPHEVLFSRRRFKQRGADYRRRALAMHPGMVDDPCPAAEPTR